MRKISRRGFLKLGAASAAVLTVGSKFTNLAGAMELKKVGQDFSPITNRERKAIPSACWQCVSRDGIIGYVEAGRLVKIEGNPKLPRTNGKVCARGQAGVNQVYDPDRVLYPMKRVGKRGEGKWKRISWNEALNEVTAKLRELRDNGHPEEFMFHYGRMKASSGKIIKSHFLAAYGTGTIGNHTTICEGGKWVAQELTWGKHYDINDVTHTNFILNFGCNLFEAHTSHVPFAQRAIKAKAERGVKLVTFDVRLSNTAAKSDEWFPIKPGTDGAVVLAMANVVMSEGLFDKDFIETWTNVTVGQLTSHLKKYTPEWAEGVSGVEAEKIRSLAVEYAQAKPGTIVSYRGAVANYTGVETERSIKMLDAILGNIDVKGGTCKAVGAKWKNSFKKPKGHAKKLNILNGFKGDAAYPNHHISHRVLKMIKDGRNGRPQMYMVYCYNPVYVNGEVQENISILKDEKLIPYYVNVNPFYDESGSLADLILPDATYLERWDWEDMVSYDQIPEYYIRQPLVKPLGEARNFADVVCEIAKRLDINLGFNSAEEFVKDACEHTPGVKEAGGFEFMKREGAWYDKKAEPLYKSYTKKLNPGDYTGKDILFDKETGVYWNWKKSKAKNREEALKKGYTDTKNAYKGYVGQKIGEEVFLGFKPDKVNKSGKFEIYSKLLEKKKFNPLPTYMPVPEHQKMKSDELILTTYKVNVQSHSRTQNCKWLTEIYHENPAWINPETAAARGIEDGDRIRVRSHLGKILTRARVTEGIKPGVVAISNHCGHWEYGRYASGKIVNRKATDVDASLKWWWRKGEHPNYLIANSPDPIGGQLRFMDTVVTVERV
ncbi:MAG: molybdopterin-dependent oxidoreductase [Nitrospirae bacterium]|nr:molybdopterin-dependent oxidoreductase [Nitrospirota bacterium]